MDHLCIRGQGHLLAENLPSQSVRVAQNLRFQLSQPRNPIPQARTKSRIVRARMARLTISIGASGSFPGSSRSPFHRWKASQVGRAPFAPNRSRTISAMMTRSGPARLKFTGGKRLHFHRSKDRIVSRQSSRLFETRFPSDSHPPQVLESRSDLPHHHVVNRRATAFP